MSTCYCLLIENIPCIRDKELRPSFSRYRLPRENVIVIIIINAGLPSTGLKNTTDNMTLSIFLTVQEWVNRATERYSPSFCTIVAPYCMTVGQQHNFVENLPQPFLGTIG